MSDEYKRVILVTGSNTGIGYEIVRGLAKKGQIVYLAARTEAKGKEAQYGSIIFYLMSISHLLQGEAQERG